MASHFRPLPPNYAWRPVAGRADAFELVLRDQHPVARAERLPDGRWLTRTHLCFSEPLQRVAIAASPRQARRWLQAWIAVAATRIGRARPDLSAHCQVSAFYFAHRQP